MKMIHQHLWMIFAMRPESAQLLANSLHFTVVFCKDRTLVGKHCHLLATYHVDIIYQTFFFH